MNGGSALVVGGRLPDVTLRYADGTDGPIVVPPGRTLVLFTFPRADTPGCTTEAMAFSAERERLFDAGADVLGVSRDSVPALARFAEKRDLTITLASDGTGALTDALGLWGERSLYGRQYMGLERATMLINDQRRITHVWRNVKVAGHVDEVMRIVAGPN